MEMPFLRNVPSLWESLRPSWDLGPSKSSERRIRIRVVQVLQSVFKKTWCRRCLNMWLRTSTRKSNVRTQLKVTEKCLIFLRRGQQIWLRNGKLSGSVMVCWTQTTCQSSVLQLTTAHTASWNTLIKSTFATILIMKVGIGMKRNLEFVLGIFSSYAKPSKSFCPLITVMPLLKRISRSTTMRLTTQRCSKSLALTVLTRNCIRSFSTLCK